MKAIDFRSPLAGLATALVLSGCVTQPPNPGQADHAAATGASVQLPQYYGLYAVDQGAVVRLDGNPDWERRTWSVRQDMAPNVRFLVFSRRLATTEQPLDQSITLARVARVRNEQTPAGPVWASPNLPGYGVTLEFQPVPDHPDMIIAQPESPLSPGLYSLHLLGGAPRNSRFGVAWSSVQESQYAAEYCVERYAGGYRPCSSAGGGATAGTTAAAGGPVAAATRFVVRGLHSARGTENGSTPILVIEGEIVNTASIPAILPALSATLLDGQDHVVQVLPSVTLPGSPLDPGGVYNFRINVSNPAAGAARVRVSPIA
jgi:hypothetical protein